MNDQLVYNAIRTPDGTVLESRARHDYKEHTDSVSRETYMVDGGLSYTRRNASHTAPYEELSLYTSDPLDKLREAFEWGSYGVSGYDPVRLIKLKDLTTDHIYNILKIQGLPSWVGDLMNKELTYRGE